MRTSETAFSAGPGTGQDAPCEVRRLLRLAVGQGSASDFCRSGAAECSLAGWVCLDRNPLGLDFASNGLPLAGHLGDRLGVPNNYQVRNEKWDHALEA
eukprot:13178529-Alexandrium_andersonii.AAC.1